MEFNLLSFQDAQTVPYSAARISRGRLRDRILLARTNRGNYAKLQVHAGDTLRIARLTVYNPRGCIIRTATNLRIRSSYSCDLDEARESSVGRDFWWHGVSPGVHYLEPTNGALFYQWPDIDDCTFAEVRSAPYEARRVERQALRDQLLYCRTSQGRYAKLVVMAGDTLRISRLVVYNADGRIHLRRSNINVPRTHTVDLDTGLVGASGYDLWWQAETESQFYLTPRNGAQISFASYFRFEKYLALLRRAELRAAMVFQDATSTRAYESWTATEKIHLREWLHMREVGQELPLWGPPALRSDRYMEACDAWKIYLAHVVQSLWVEANSRVPWRLSGAAHLEHLFDSRKLLSYNAQGHSFEFFTMGAVTHWNIPFTYDFLVEQNLIARDHWGTIQRLTDWIRAHLIHITGYQYDSDGGPFTTQADQWAHIYGYRGLPLVDRMINPLPGRRHITHGCWGTDGFFAAVLRTVNIPVRHGRSNFSGANHSRPEFFTAGRNLAHGDDPYNGWIRLGHNNVPIGEIFLDNSQLASLIDAPAPRPGMTVAETASYNKSRHFVRLAVQYKTNWLLRLRCQDVRTGATDTSARLWESLHDFYTDAQIATIAADCDTAIAAIPGGCTAI